MTREFSITREIARREIEQHQRRFVGITVSAPAHKDVNGLLEYVVDVRVGADSEWELVRDCLIAQWAVGAVSDMNIPVLCERGENGRVTVIARSVIRLADIAYDTYNLDSLEFEFMSLRSDAGGTWRDGFGYAAGAPSGEPEDHKLYTWNAEKIGWGDTDFEYGVTELDAVAAGWEETEA